MNVPKAMKNTFCLLIAFLAIFSSSIYGQDFVKLDDVHRLNLLERPKQGVSVVLDTDTYNEIDDQFALVYALLSEKNFQLEAVYAAPFSNKRADNPGLGMELSYEEIVRILDLMKKDPKDFAFKGSKKYVSSDLVPESSPATTDLIERARKHSPDNPLYVVPVGAITNIANAILLEPKITRKYCRRLARRSCA